MVAMYEPYVEVCRRLAELSPVPRRPSRSRCCSTAAPRPIENAVKVARAFTGRPRRDRVRPRLPRPHEPDDGDDRRRSTRTSTGSGRCAGEVYRAPAPYPYRGITTDDAIAGLHAIFKEDVDPGDVACMVLEPVQGEGGFIPMPEDFVRALREICDEHGILYVDDEVQAGMGRTGPVWAIEHYEGVEPDILVSGKSLGGGLPLAAITARAEIMDAPEKGGLGGTFGGNPLSCAAALRGARHRRVAGVPRADRPPRRALRSRARRASPREHDVRRRGPRPRPDARAGARHRASARSTRRRPRASAASILLSCGYDGNVVRILVPHVIEDDDLERGLQILDEALGAA